MARTCRSYSAVCCSFLIWLSVIQALETRFRFDRMFLQGTSSKPYFKRWGGSNVSECALECGRWSECKSFSVRPSLQECSLYSRQITLLDITPASASETETFYWKHHYRCSQEEGYASVPGTYKCLRLHGETKNWTEAEATCEAEGGHLAIIEDLATWRAVRAFLEGSGWNSGDSYLGGVKTSTGQWLWLDGRAVAKNLWMPGEPNNTGGNAKCVNLWWGNRTCSFLLIDDLPCNFVLPFLCEI